MDVPVIAKTVETVLNQVRGTGDLRVWSIIVTIMGDMAREPGETVSGAVLSSLMGALGIRPEATRVALHRLRKDGWISSQREGRGSLYALTNHGRTQTLSVTARIYGPDRPTPKAWHLALTNLTPDQLAAEETLTVQGFVKIAPALFLGAEKPNHATGLLLFSDTHPSFPAELEALIFPTSLRNEAARLQTALIQTEKMDVGSLDARSRAALRILILHSWRRIALRLPDLPLDLLWQQANLRHDVQDLLARIGNIEQSELSAC